LIIKTISRLLIERGNYIPFEDRGEIYVADNRAVLHRYGPEGYVAVELVNGDWLSPEQIKADLEVIRERQEQLKKEKIGSYYFKVLFFSSDLPKEKQEILALEEYNKGINGNYLCCMSVNIEKKEVVKYYKYPLVSYGIESQIKYFFSEGFDEDYGNVDFNELKNKRDKTYTIELGNEKPWITYILIAVNIVVWLLLEVYAKSKGVDASSLLIDFGAKENTRIMMGEYWRFLTPVFLHNGITHLLVNSYSLYILGNTVERLLGKGKFLFVYIMSGLMGSIVSFIFSISPSVGASGAIFGLMGTLIYYGIEHPELLKKGFGRSILTTLAINIVYGISVPRIDNFGHFGGLIGGFLASGAVGLRNVRRSLKKRAAYTAALAVVLSVSLCYGFTNSQNRSLGKLELMSRFFEEGNWGETEKMGEEIIEAGAKNKAILANVLWNLSTAEAIQGKYDEAIEHAQMLIEVNPGNGHLLLGQIYLETGNIELGVKELEEASEADRDLSNIVDRILNEINHNK